MSAVAPFFNPQFLMSRRNLDKLINAAIRQRRHCPVRAAAHDIERDAVEIGFAETVSPHCPDIIAGVVSQPAAR